MVYCNLVSDIISIAVSILVNKIDVKPDRRQTLSPSFLFYFDLTPKECLLVKNKVYFRRYFMTK